MKSNLKSKYRHSKTNRVVNINKKSMILENHNNKINWTRYKISDIGVVTGGGTPSTKIKKYFNGDIPWITPKDLSNYKKIYIGKGHNNITEEGLLNSSARLLQKNTILFTTRAPIGYVAIAKNVLTTNQGFRSITCNDKTHNIFIYYWLKHNKKNIECLSSGTTFEEISGSTLKNIELDLPSYNKQKEIAKILYDLDMKIENLQKQNKILKQMALSIFKSWFVDFDGITEFKDSELGKIPKGWSVDILSNNIEIKKGRKPKDVLNYKKEGYLPQILLEIFDRGKCSYANTANMIFSEKTDTLMVMDGISSGRSEIGYMGVVGSTIAKISFMRNPYFFHYVIKNLERAIKSNLTGSAIPHVDKNFLNCTMLTIPTSNILNDFEKFALILHEQIDNNKKQVCVLIKMRYTLLPKLISGEIQV